MIEYLICALRNLGRKKLRTILTVSGIAIGVASVIIIGAIGQGGKNAVAGELDSLGINGLDISANSSSTLGSQPVIDDNDVKTCLSIKGVESAMPVIMQTGSAFIHGTEKSALYWGIGNEAGSIISIKLLYGQMISKSDINSHAQVCLVDDTFAQSLFKRTNVTGEKVLAYLGDNYQELVIKGVVSSGSSILYNLVGNYVPTFIYIPYSTAEDLRGEPGYDEIAIKTASNDNIDSIGQRVVNLLSRNNGYVAQQPYVASNMFKQKQRLSDLLNIVTLIISAVGAISLVVAGLGIMTVMTVSVSERTREIGIKKAIGAKKKVIMLEFLFEALAISFLGGIIGITIGAGLSYIASIIMNFGFSVSLNSVLISSSFAVLVGVLFGVYPAVKAAQLKPVDALRHE